MNTLGTGKLYVKGLFGKSRFYRIPEYQRPYVWGTEQVTDLLNDVTSAMDADAGKEYFIGCMIWNDKTHTSGEYRFDIHDILDGQQRFITLFLLHAVLRDLSHDDKLAQKVSERLRQEEDTYDNIPERNRIEFVVRDDKEFLADWVLEPGATGNIADLRHIESDNSRSVSVRRMAGVLVDMHHWWTQRLGELEPDQREDYIADFFGYLSNNVLALYLSTPDNLDDAYNLFTVLNSRGLQLRSADIIRAQNLRQITDEDKRLQLARTWESYDDAIREPLDSFDELLMATALSQIKFTSGKTKTIRHAFDYLIERKDLQPGEQFFSLVGQYVGHFKAISVPNLQIPAEQQTDFRNLYFILGKTLGSQFVMPLLYYRNVFGDHHILDFFVRLDNILSMSWLLGYRTAKVRIFAIMRRMDEIAAGEGSKPAQAQQFLADEVMTYGYSHSRSRTDMDLDEFAQLLDEEEWGAFGGQKLNKTRYLLLKLDLLHANSQTRLDFNRAKSSVEHILPQKPQHAYPDLPAEAHEQWVHRLGNLVLLDVKKNSSLSNAAYPDKRERYQKHFEARPYTQSIFMRHGQWDLDRLRSQHQYAVGLLRDYYAANSHQALTDLRAKPLTTPQLF